MNNVIDNNVINNEQLNTALMTTSDRIAAMREKAAQPVTLWTPLEPGEMLVGELIGKREVSTQYGMNGQFILKDENGNLSCYWLTKYIETSLRAQNAEYNDLVAIRFDGKRRSSAGKEFNSFQVTVEKI